MGVRDVHRINDSPNLQTKHCCNVFFASIPSATQKFWVIRQIWGEHSPLLDDSKGWGLSFERGNLSIFFGDERLSMCRCPFRFFLGDPIVFSEGRDETHSTNEFNPVKEIMHADFWAQFGIKFLEQNSEETQYLGDTNERFKARITCQSRFFGKSRRMKSISKPQLLVEVYTI